MLLLLLTMEGLTCVLILLYQPAIYTSMRTVLQQRLIQDYGREGFEDFTLSIDYTQHLFSCCGVVSPSDYQTTAITTWRLPSLSRLEVPNTCCTLLNKGVRTTDIIQLLYYCTIVLLCYCTIVQCISNKF